MRLKRFIRRAFRVQYRLTVYAGGKYHNTYGTKRRLLTGIAKRTPCDYWSIYKTGPLWLPEREVDNSEWKGGIR